MVRCTIELGDNYDAVYRAGQLIKGGSLLNKFLKYFYNLRYGKLNRHD